jgi:hypothetical protein
MKILKNKNSLNSIKRASSQSSGRDYKEVMKETRERYLTDIKPITLVKEFEKI